MSPSGERSTPLSALVASYPPIRSSRPLEEVSVSGLTTDSRVVKPGDVFVAIAGNAGNGEAYAAAAATAGAVAVICREGALGDLPERVVRLEVNDPRLAAARYAGAFYAPQPRHIVAVTGTDGKSSTVEFLRQLWAHAGIPGAALGTIGLSATIPLAGAYDAINTTPDPIVLHRLLAALKTEGIDHVALEASSHGLDQQRLGGITPEIAVFTTFGQDHLDYHATSEAYFEAKAKLFSQVMQEGGVAVLNADEPRILSVAPLAEARRGRILTFGSNGTDARMIGVEPVAGGQRVALRLGGAAWQGILPLYGRFQVMNILAAAGAALAGGMAPETIFAALPGMRGVRGRLERVAMRRDAPVFVDYAHTAQGLEQAVAALRPHTEGKLRLVFGCGGDRDAGKRPEMGAVAARLADDVIVTDDNPRREDPATIRAAILAACPAAREIGDRALAIRTAIGELVEGDVLLIAGKGHETTQIVGDQKHPFDDASVAREAAA